jgi:glycosyltransferase involved in cell wall biosynthesis
MRVLSIGTDASIFEPSSAPRARQRAYAKEFGQMDIVILTKTSQELVHEEHLSLFPAESSSPLTRLFRAYRVACTLAKPDVVTVQDPFETGLVGLFVARHLGVPLHIQVHTDFLSPEYARHSLLNRTRILIAGFVLRRASRIRVVSERIKAGIEARYKPQKNIAVLPIFVDIEKFKNAQPISGDTFIDSHQPNLLVVARNTPEKNIALAIDAFKRVAPKGAGLLITGEKDAIQALAGDDNRVRAINTMDPSRYYKSADLVLVPSVYEGYGLVIIEGLAAGKPVLSTDVGIAREAGAIVTSPEKFADALAEWFKSGPRTGELKNYPYKNFDEYVRAYAEDIRACVQKGEK